MSWQQAAAAHRAIRNYEASHYGKHQQRIAELEARIAELEEQLAAKPTEIVKTVEIPVFRRPALEAPLAYGDGLRMLEVQRAVAEHFGMDQVCINSERRDKKTARARQIAIYLCCHHSAYSLPQIGRHFGGRDHTTVLHSRTRIEDLLKTDAKLAADVAAIKAALGVVKADTSNEQQA